MRSAISIGLLRPMDPVIHRTNLVFLETGEIWRDRKPVFREHEIWTEPVPFIERLIGVPVQAERVEADALEAQAFRRSLRARTSLPSAALHAGERRSQLQRMKRRSHPRT